MVDAVDLGTQDPDLGLYGLWVYGLWGHVHFTVLLRDGPAALPVALDCDVLFIKTISLQLDPNPTAFCQIFSIVSAVSLGPFHLGSRFLATWQGCCRSCQAAVPSCLAKHATSITALYPSMYLQPLLPTCIRSLYRNSIADECRLAPDNTMENSHGTGQLQLHCIVVQ